MGNLLLRKRRLSTPAGIAYATGNAAGEYFRVVACFRLNLKSKSCFRNSVNFRVLPRVKEIQGDNGMPAIFRSRISGPIAFFVVLALFAPAILLAQSVTPPAQPASGPGGKQYAHASVTKNRYGKGGQEYWIFEPDTPKPSIAPVVVFLHGWGGMNPMYYGAWIDHLVKRGNIVMYPRYQASLLTSIQEFTPNTVKAIKDGIERLQTEPGHVKPDLNRFAAVGHSMGGLLAASVAAMASESGLPRVSAVMSVEPGITQAPISFPLADLKKISAETLLLAV